MQYDFAVTLKDSGRLIGGWVSISRTKDAKDTSAMS